MAFGKSISLVAAVVLMTAPVAGDTYPSERERVATDIEACSQDPRFGLIGGSMIGDCLFEKAEEVEGEIRLLLRDQAKAYCRPHEREAFEATQSRWMEYRDSWCGMVEASPGNTHAYVNAMACRLNQARDRRAGLRFLDTVGRPNCPFLRLERRESHFGDPAGQRARIGVTPIVWEVSDSGGELQVMSEIRYDRRSLGEIDISTCAFCDANDENCDDGVFSLQRSVEMVEERHLLFACHTTDGGRWLELYRLLEAEPVERVWQVERAEGFAWQLLVKQLQVTPVTGPTVVWPE